ncbi:HNH endonuclease [Promicromonospora aerolata]|uniref:HNH endonuclease n=1 Tax=Promicromonospora aerolata TaxID=195749 RepID=A0ABW4VE24_9MICO
MILPGATDMTGPAQQQVQAEWVDLLGELEALKNTAAAAQARLAVALEQATRSDEARQGIRAERRGRGVPSQVGAAMQSSPHGGGSFLGTARAWVTEMPYTFDALRTGVLSQWRATLMVRETAHLSAEHRARIDEEVCGPAHRAALARMGTKRLIAKVKELAARFDVDACVKRNAKAVSERCVSVRPAPDLMVYLTALVPMQQGVQAYARLKKEAESARATGDERGTGQIMADTLVERITGREPGKADDVPVTINLLVSDQTLLTGGDLTSTDLTSTDPTGSGGQPGTEQPADQPAVVVEGAAAGAGTVPGPVARALVAHAIDADAAWLRAIYVDPRGRLLATTSTSRFHPPGLSALLRAREQGICATAWCDAPVRHIDHVTPHADGGRTSLDNGQGLCVRCNHAKQAPGWTQHPTDVEGRHAVETITPTGHAYTTVVPVPPKPVRESAPEWTTATGTAGPGPGRIPRSRYSLGCGVPRRRGTVAYRPPGRRRAPGRLPRADLTWAHPR